MDDYYVFHRTVRGYGHKKRNIPCEDVSACCKEKNGKYYIAAVADGHGDRACIRSAIGAGLAVKTAVGCLKDFAENVLDGTAGEWDIGVMEKLSSGHRDEVLRQLTDTLAAQWNDAVQSHIQKFPFLDTGLAQAEGEAGGEKEWVHAYGTTLIAALQLPGYLLLFQQGDGRCEIFYEDGEAVQPIPWDDRCYQNVTTSMCDADVADSIRACVVPLKNRKVTACYLGSDGVEDSYRNMEGTHMFYRELSCVLSDLARDHKLTKGSRRDAGVFPKKLYGILKRLSRERSGDDVSVAGIVDIDALTMQVSEFKRQIKRYSLEEKQICYENRRISMSRKHRILHERMEKAEQNQRDKEMEMEKEMTEAQRQYDQAKKEFEDYDKRFQEILEGIKKVKEELAALDQNQGCMEQACQTRQ